MYRRLDWAHRRVVLLLGLLTIFGAFVLLVWDAYPRLFSARAHDLLAATPLATIPVAYLLYQAMHRPPWREWVKAALLSIAFLLWAANQYWPDSPHALFYNDLAIVLFVLDVFLVIIGWPPDVGDESFAETAGEDDPRPPALD